MFAKCKVLFGGFMSVCLWTDVAVAKPVDVIRPEDEAILEGIFDVEGQSSKQQSNSSLADGHGVQMKGARDVTRVKAVPLSVTLGERVSRVAVEADGEKENKKDTSVKTSVDNARETTVEVNSGADLKNAMKTVVEGNTQKNTESTEVIVKNENKSQLKVNGESTVNGVSEYRYQDKIKYTYPSKSERAKARQSLSEWYNPNLRAVDTYKTETEAAPQDETFVQYRLAIADCLDKRQSELETDKGMLYQGNMYDAAAYLSQTLEAVNACYENIGYDIIRVYYGDDPQIKQSFAQNIQNFYIRSSDVNFNPKFCGDDCSVEAMVDAQMAKFADFRTYLAKLLAERPMKSPAVAPMIDITSEQDTVASQGEENVGEIKYDEDGVPFIDEYLEEDAQARQGSVWSQEKDKNAPTHGSTLNEQNNRYELPEIL